MKEWHCIFVSRCPNFGCGSPDQWVDIASNRRKCLKCGQVWAPVFWKQVSERRRELKPVQDEEERDDQADPAEGDGG